ncbi:MAG: BACON domain-containing protein [Alistipes sp.]|nr:BACON domain-containing protein [Alistipes sp.]
MANKLFKSFFAVALVLGSALGFVACEDKGDDVVADPKVEVSATSLNFTMEEGSQSVELTANSDWKVEVDDADWVTVTPTAGKGDATLTVAVAMNESGAVRTSIVKVIALHKEYGNWDTKKITVSQSASETPTVEEELLYGDNFDGEEATKTYGSGSSWPYLDQFPQFANPEGPAAENVTYSGKGVSIRANSTSDSQYSDYAGSGSNNIFFGSSAYFQVNNITLAEGQQNLKLTFGSEKYIKDDDSTFKNEEFHIYLSKDGNGWAEIKEYTFAGTEGGRWNVATAEFTLTSVPETLYLKFAATVASVYRLDDVKLFSGNGGQTIDLDNIEAPEPVEAKKVTVAEFLEAAEDSTVYELTGEITNVTNTTYGNFYLKDSTGEVLIYGLCSPTGEQKYWAESGAKVGDTITVQTVRTSYNGTPQGKDAIFVSLVPGEGGQEPNPEPAEGPYASDVPFVCSSDDSTNCVYSLGTTTIDGSAATGFKLGTGKKSGYFKSAALGVSGDKYLNFYAVAWKGKSATLYYRVDGGAAQTLELTANDGATSNPPYNALVFADSDHYSVKLEGLTATSTIEFATDSSFTVVENDASGRAIVCGVKLTDEPLGNEGGNDEPAPEPEPTPGDTMTIADVLAKGEGATIGGVIEGVVISNMELNNLTSKKGMYVQDETGALQFYLAANHEFAFGTKVKIDLTTATLGSYNGAVQVSGVALDKITVVSTGNAVEAKSVSMADFLANKYEGQYIALEGVQVAASDLSNTWVMGGAHTSIAMEDANGNSFVVFSSKYASYGAETVAQGAGTIKGISSISKGAIQIIFAQASDYAGLNGERFGDDSGEEPGDDPVSPEGWAGRDDFNTISSNSSYIARESTAGWVGENCAVQSGGATDANPVFNSMLGSDENTRAWVINGKTSAVGKITSPVISTGCGTLTFNYSMAFSEKNGYDFNVDIMQNGEVVKTYNVVNADNTKYAKFTFSEEVNVAGDFQIVITNNCPSATDGNKDRYSIWDVMWTAYN